MTDTRSEAATSVRRRRFLRAAGASGLAGLAGCQSLGEDPPQDSGAGESSGTPATANGTVTGNATLNPFTVGVLKTDFGGDVKRSAKIAVDELNESGRIDGKAKLISVSGNPSPKGEEQAYRKLVSRGADITIGGLYPRGFLPAMAEKEKLHFTSVSPWPLPARLISRSVSPVNGSPEEEYEKYKYFFRVGPLNLIDLQKAQVQLVANYASDLGWDRVGIVVENLNIGADERVSALQDRMSDHVDVPVAEVVSGSVNDWTPIFDKLENANVDLAAVFLVISAVVANKQWADQQRNFQMGGIHLPAMEKGYWESVNGAADSLWTMNAATPLTSNTAQTQPFLTEYGNRYGGTPAYVGPISYDAVKLYAHGIEQVGSRDPEKLIPFFEEECTFTGGTFMPEMGFRGPDQEFAHDPQWDSIQKSGVPVFQQWQPADGGGGRMEAFAPAKNKTAEYILPPWQR